MISVVILTYNEEKDLPSCLDSVTFSDDVHILDSGSEDRTLEIARERDIATAVRPFDTFARQRNWALDHMPLKYEWVFFLDADERAAKAFRDALLAVLESADASVSGYYCCWKLILEDRWLRRSDSFPKWQLRVLRKGRARFRDFGHGQKEHTVEGRLDYISEPYLHYAFSKGWTHWWGRHNRYSSEEAAARLREKRKVREIFSRHGSKRNIALKLHLSRLPGWPLLRFFHAYFLKLGFLEGREGLTYCLNISIYEYLIKLKMRELRKKNPD